MASSLTIDSESKQRIIVVGGGAGGLCLVSRLSRIVPQSIEVVLVDQSMTHLWKPLLHEVAAGTMNSFEDEISYLAHSLEHGYVFRLGSLEAIDVTSNHITLAAIHDRSGEQILPQRQMSFTALVLAIGSQSNDFSTTGVSSHCFFLDSLSQAQRLHQRVLSLFLRAQETCSADDTDVPLNITVIGAGATGVELAAELHTASRYIVERGFGGLSMHSINITLIEAGPNILAGQTASLVNGTKKELHKLGIKLHLSTRVTEVKENAVVTDVAGTLLSDLTVWCAGIKAPKILTDLGCFAVNRQGQVSVAATLQTHDHNNIFALGDCAELILNGTKIPPRAQVALQQANFLSNNILRFLRGSVMEEYSYKDYGSIVAVGDASSYGTIMGFALGRWNIHGLVAHWIYILLYRKHQMAIHGKYKTLIYMIKDWFTRRIGPKCKLH